MNIGKIGEFGLINIINKTLGTKNKTIIKGIGDDAAALKLENNNLTLLTTDMLIEGIHFDLSYCDPYHIGAKALAVNISDVAAMGGNPTFYLLSIALPEQTDQVFFENLIKGFHDISDRFGISLIGGDTVASKDNIVINISLLGDVAKEEMICRNNAQKGDKIFVTGTIGDSAAGLAILTGKPGPTDINQKYHSLIAKHLNPSPRVEVARLIAKMKIANAMIDVSDGLAIDLQRICDESLVSGKIWLQDIPLSKDYKMAKKDFGFSVEHPLTGGEDYELLFTVPDNQLDKLFGISQNLDCSITKIGEICHGQGVEIIDKYDKPVKLDKLGYEHFKV